MITFLHTITTLIGIGDFLLAFYFWKTNSGSRIRWIAGLIAFSMGVWVIMNVLTSYHDRSQLTDMAAPILFFATVVLMFSIVHLALEFPYPMFRVDQLHILLLYLPALIYAYMLFFTHDIVKEYQLDRHSSGYIIPGHEYPLFAGLVVVATVATFCLLVYKLRRLTGTHRRNTMLVLFSFVIPSLPALYFVLTHEAEGTGYNSLISPIVSSVWLGITSYIVLKK